MTTEQHTKTGDHWSYRFTSKLLPSLIGVLIAASMYPWGATP